MFIIQQCNKSYLLDCKLSLTFSSCRFSEGSARARWEVIFFSLKFRSKFFETVLSCGEGLGKITLPPPLVRARFARVAQSCSRQNRHATQARSMPGGHGNRSNWTMHNTHGSYYSDRIIANAIVSWDENFYINSLWKGIYSANLVFIWYNQICRKEGKINVTLTNREPVHRMYSHLIAAMKNTVEFLTAQRTRIEVQDPYLGTGKFPDSDNP